MHDDHRRGPRSEGWGPPWGGRGEALRRGRAEWDYAMGDPEGPGGPGFGPGGPGRGPGGPGGPGRGWGPGRRGAWGWEGPGMPPVPPPDFGPGFGPGFGRKRGYGGGPGHRRARRGDVRGAILDLLAEGQPWNGYQIIQEIAQRTNGIWRPSAGSVYPALQQLEDEGLISPEGEGRRRMYTLTAEGRAYAEAHREELRASWDAVAGMTDDAAVELGNMIRQIMMAVMEVRRAGSPGQLAEARRVLAETRRSLYRILADDVEDEEGEDTSAVPGSAAGGGEADGEQGAG
jgi:DNA-binding PadR family transcriptional regulator